MSTPPRLHALRRWAGAISVSERVRVRCTSPAAIRVALPLPLWRRVGGRTCEIGESSVRLRCEHLEYVAVRISEIKPASATTVIDLHVVEGAGSAAINNALGTDSVEDAVKLRFIDFEGVVVTLEIRVVVEIEGQRVVDPQRREVRERTVIAQTQDPGEEARRCFLVMRGHDRMVEHNSHRHLPAGAPVISSEIGRGVADFKARGAWRLPASGIADDRTSSAVVDRNRRHLVPGMTIDKSEKGRQQFAFVLGRGGADLGGDGLGRATAELKRALELLVLPPGGVLALAPDPHVGSAAAFPDRGLFGDESSIKACPCARNDLDDFHERPLPRLPVGKIYNDRPPQHYPGTVHNGPGRPSEHRRSAAPFRRFRCRMGGRWDVALARFCWISCMVGAVVLPTAAARTQDRPLSACRFEVAGTGKVRAISDGRSFILEDGREIRLAAIEVPLAPAAGESGPRAEAGLAARAALESMLASQSVVELRQNAAGADRYGRTLAMVYVMHDGARQSVAHEMLTRGIARVSAHVGDRPCAEELLAQERGARRAKLGLWSEPYYVIVAAESGAQLAAERGRFTVAEGNVLSVRESAGTIYMNFGRRWSQALTVTISKRDERVFAAAGVEPKKLENRRVRVRGWVEERNGPGHEVTHPEQIEIAERN